MSIITCITLSSSPFRRNDLPQWVEYLNHVSVFSNAKGLQQAIFDSVSAVRTDSFIFVDDDDPWPAGIDSNFIAPKGILCAKELINGRIKDASSLSLSDLVQTPRALHKVVCNTALAKMLLPYIPKGNYVMEWMLYGGIASLGGVEFDKDFIYTWTPRKGGMHTRLENVLKPTREWVTTVLPEVTRLIERKLNASA